MFQSLLPIFSSSFLHQDDRMRNSKVLSPPSHDDIRATSPEVRTHNIQLSSCQSDQLMTMTRNPPQGIVVVVVQRGEDLIKRDFMGKADPYVLVSCGNHSRRTPVRMKSLDPVWNQQFVIPVYNLRDYVRFEVRGRSYMDLLLFLLHILQAYTLISSHGSIIQYSHTRPSPLALLAFPSYPSFLYFFVFLFLSSPSSHLPLALTQKELITAHILYSLHRLSPVAPLPSPGL